MMKTAHLFYDTPPQDGTGLDRKDEKEGGRKSLAALTHPNITMLRRVPDDPSTLSVMCGGLRQLFAERGLAVQSKTKLRYYPRRVQKEITEETARVLSCNAKKLSLSVEELVTLLVILHEPRVQGGGTVPAPRQGTAPVTRQGMVALAHPNREILRRLPDDPGAVLAMCGLLEAHLDGLTRGNTGNTRTRLVWPETSAVLSRTAKGLGIPVSQVITLLVFLNAPEVSWTPRRTPEEKMKYDYTAAKIMHRKAEAEWRSCMNKLRREKEKEAKEAKRRLLVCAYAESIRELLDWDTLSQTQITKLGKTWMRRNWWISTEKLDRIGNRLKSKNREDETGYRDKTEMKKIRNVVERNGLLRG